MPKHIGTPGGSLAPIRVNELTPHHSVIVIRTQTGVRLCGNKCSCYVVGAERTLNPRPFFFSPAKNGLGTMLGVKVTQWSHCHCAGGVMSSK